MPLSESLDERLERLSNEVDGWTRAVFETYRPASDRFTGFLSYPLGWVDASLRPLAPPAPSGKRLRPALCLLTAEAVGGDYGPALPAASAIELIHNFSLVHDDIQDESPLRRGRPTVWENWGAAQAINVGDSIFALSQLALYHKSTLPPALQVELSQRLNLTCLRLVEGQFRDLDLQDARGANFEAYQTMVAGKTAALIECAAGLGARCGGVDQTRAGSFARFGFQLGLAFQFQDDLLGVWGDSVLTGKPADADLRTRKQALPAVLGLRASGPVAARFRDLFLSADELSADDAHKAALLLVELGVRDQTQALVDAGYERASAELEQALQGQPGASLWELLERFRLRSH
jgi:geranylgeranyl diphosphate synthase, type I